MTEKKIPVLTERVTLPDMTAAALSDEELAELQTRIATRSYALMEKLLHESLHEALRELEANLLADVIGRLRTELPDLIDEALHEHFDGHASRR